MGVIRIGTLSDFRKSEHKRGIADATEGKKSVVKEVEHLVIEDPNQPEALELKQFGMHVGAKCEFMNCSFEKQFEEDLYILCTSTKCSAQTCTEFEGANSCIQIIDVPSFYRTLTEALNSVCRVAFRGVQPVVYGERKQKWTGRDWGRHAALIKETKFCKQYEVRAIWTPLSSDPIRPLILADYRLGKYCCHKEDFAGAPAVAA